LETIPGESVVIIHSISNWIPAGIQPVNWETAIALGVVLILLLISALISGSEVAFFSLGPSVYKELRQRKTRKSKLILKLLEKPRYLLATILITNNLVNIGIIILSYFIIRQVFTFESTLAAFLINVVLVTLLLVLFGEVMPKVYANVHNLTFASRMARPLYILRQLFKPLSYLLVHSTALVDRRIVRHHPEQATRDEIDQAIDIAAGKSATEEELSMLKGIVQFGNITVRQIMRSRVDTVAIDLNSNYEEVYRIVNESGFSRFPVYRDDLDHVEGFLYAKDMLPYLDEGKDFAWQQLIRPPIFVPENKKIDDLLFEFQQKKIHLAVVVDEYGGTSGIVSLEDILEEIFGEIKDEFDYQTEIEYEQLDENTYVFEGKTLINDVCKVLDLPGDYFDEVRGESDSVAGLVLEINGKFPAPGEAVVYKNFRFSVVSATKRRIKKIKLTILHDNL